MKQLAFLVTVGLLAVGGAVFWQNRHERSDGPLFAGLDGSSTGQRLAVGADYSIGHALLRNRGSKPATVERVRLLGVTDGLELLGVYSRPVPDEQDRGMFLGDFGFPPAQWPSKPLAEQNVVPVAKTLTPSGEPGEGLELVIGVRATRPGVARARAIEFTYRIGGRRYREEYEGAIYLCAPFEQYTSETCPGDAEGRFSDEVAE